MERDVESFRTRTERVVIAEHRHHLHVHLAKGVPDQQIRNAMMLLRGQYNRAPGTELRKANHRSRRQIGADFRLKARFFQFSLELGPHEETAGSSIHKLLIA